MTSGRFIAEALQFAEGRNVKLIDGSHLQRMIREARGAGERLRPVAGALAPPQVASPPSTAALPNCPLCGKTMVQRTAKRGANAGSAFWSCAGYPACRGTRPIA